MKNIRKRGSVLIFCVVLMASVSTILMSTADVGQFTTLRQLRTEDDVRFDYTEDSIKAIFTQKARETSLILPSDETLTINGYNVLVSARAGTGAQSRMVELDTTITGRRATRRRQLFIGSRGPVSPMWFAFGTDSDFVPIRDVTITGDAYLGGDYILGGTVTQVTGDLYCQRQTLSDQMMVGGATTLGRRLVSPILDSDSYLAAASSKTSGNQVCKSLSHSSMGGYQSLWYHTGNLVFDVQYRGRGTVFVKGDVEIKKFDRDSGTAEGLIIVEGNVDFKTDIFEGFLICSGEVRVATGARVDVRGAIWANIFELGNKRLTVDFDNFFWNNPTFDKRMRVPGMW